MSKKLAIAMFALSVFCSVSSAFPNVDSDDPCRNEQSNVEIRACYSKKQLRANRDADKLAKEIATDFRKEAGDFPTSKGISESLRKAAAGVDSSQKLWREYRDQHCEAVADSWTSGSGAGAAYEKCLLQLGRERLLELRSSFNLPDTK